MKKLIYLILLLSTLSFAGDKVIIGAWGDYPTATGKIIDNDDNDDISNDGSAWDDFPTTMNKNGKPDENEDKDTQYIIPNNTKGEVITWSPAYTTLKNPFAKIDMWSESKIKILNGPLKGKTLMIQHIYISLQ